MPTINKLSLDGILYDISSNIKCKYNDRIALTSYTEKSPYICQSNGLLVLSPITSSCCFTVKDTSGGSFNFRASFGSNDQNTVVVPVYKDFKIFKLDGGGTAYFIPLIIQ